MSYLMSLIKNTHDKFWKVLLSAFTVVTTALTLAMIAVMTFTPRTDKDRHYE